MSDTQDHLANEVGHLDVQEMARQLLRRLMAERNLRSSAMSQLLDVETHTLRRILNGARPINLQEMVVIAQLGGYSLDEHLLHGAPVGHARALPAAAGHSFEESLSRVFGALAELLDGAEPEPAPLPQRVPAVRPPRRRRSPAELRGEAPRPRQAPPADPDAPRRGRGRPRKYVLPDEKDLPGPQW